MVAQCIGVLGNYEGMTATMMAQRFFFRARIPINWFGHNNMFACLLRFVSLKSTCLCVFMSCMLSSLRGT